jgi:SagB-type dehydrogenase family enzyme
MPKTRAGHGWGTWDPLASGFHFGTKDIEWSGVEAERFDEAGARRAPAPPAVKPHTTRGRKLPPPRRGAEFVRVLRARRTWRGFGSRPLPLADLATLLHLTFGVQMEGRTETGVRVLFKTSPSSGARHPIEAYVLAVRVAGLPAGLYHYAPDTGRLHQVRKGASARQVVGYLSGQWWFAGAGAVVFMTAVLPRVWWRYGHPRAYRSVLLGAGHLCQTFCLVATWLKLAPFCTQALADSRIERDLKVDGVDEVLLYAAGVGTRPPGGRWVQWPSGRPPEPGPSRRQR